MKESNTSILTVKIRLHFEGKLKSNVWKKKRINYR